MIIGTGKMDLATKIAQEIIKKLREHSAPGESTWGDKYPEAHKELFKDFEDDLIEDVKEVLNSPKFARMFW